MDTSSLVATGSSVFNGTSLTTVSDEHDAFVHHTKQVFGGTEISVPVLDYLFYQTTNPADPVPSVTSAE